VIHGVLGAIVYILVARLGWEMRAEILRRLALGAIIGYLVFVADLPNQLTALGLGYLGVDAVEAILDRLALSRSSRR